MVILSKKTSQPEKNCPFCGSDNISSIIYGYPSPELLDKAARGEVSLGGCVITNYDPNKKCNVCGKSWNTHDIT